MKHVVLIYTVRVKIHLFLLPHGLKRKGTCHARALS